MFSGSLVAIVTPMRADGAIDWAAWERLLAMHVAAGTTGIVIAGTTGESVTLHADEVLELLRRARSVLGRRAALLVGAASSSTADTVSRVTRLSGSGLADALLVVTPAYNKPSQEGLYRHYAAVADASSVPIVLYNVPSRTAVDLLPATVARLSKLSRVVAVKEAVASMERIRELVAVTEGRLAVLSGDDVTVLQAIANGARGVISVTANVVPDVMAALCTAALRGDQATAARIDASVQPLHEALFVEANPIPVKWLLADLGLIGPGIRLPLTPLAEPLHARVRAAYEHMRSRPLTTQAALA